MTKTPTINRDDYMEGRIDHQAFYLAVADAIGRKPLQAMVLHIASIEHLAEVFNGPDGQHFNQIPLIKWDACDGQVRALIAAGRGQAVNAISWSRKAQQPKPGTFIWSLGETVCVLKAVARALVEERAQVTP